jgi:hypothetical protein
MSINFGYFIVAQSLRLPDQWVSHWLDGLRVGIFQLLDELDDTRQTLDVDGKLDGVNGKARQVRNFFDFFGLEAHAQSRGKNSRGIIHLALMKILSVVTLAQLFSTPSSREKSYAQTP